MTDELKWLEQSVAAKLVRIEAATFREQAMLRRSVECLARSAELLSVPVPKVWHTAPPKSDLC